MIWKKLSVMLMDIACWKHLPELFWELPGDAVSRIRYEYHDHIAERFAEAFADTVEAGVRNMALP